ncbi:autoinducer binding domain-containing protein [Neisseriaceae bacterium TC5R-5]|nr:autoinducer binding domain-containing protein [Neisseriaceae bacterium TC5R-5]
MSVFLEKTEVMEAINHLQSCATKAEAGRLTKKIVVALGGESFVYTLLLPPGVNHPKPSFQFLIGCDAEFCRVYDQRMWFLNDPFLDYAYKNSTPRLNSMITKHTPGQIEMAEFGAQYGFRSGLVIPTHTYMAASQRMGLLYVGSSLERPVGEPLLMRNRAQFAALATELLWWWCEYLRQQAVKKFSITADEIALLELAKGGKVAEEMAVFLNMSPSSVYRKISTIKDKLNVKKIEHAVIEAQAFGLLE